MKLKYHLKIKKPGREDLFSHHPIPICLAPGTWLACHICQAISIAPLVYQPESSNKHISVLLNIVRHKKHQGDMRFRKEQLHK